MPGTWSGPPPDRSEEWRNPGLEHKQNLTFVIFFQKVPRFFENRQNGLKLVAKKCYGGVVSTPGFKKFKKSGKILKIEKTRISGKPLRENATDGSLSAVDPGHRTKEGFWRSKVSFLNIYFARVTAKSKMTKKVINWSSGHDLDWGPRI